ncbi:MAG: helix-turn-helix domain-containing protein [Methanobrevibacter sp.]|jgi:hypothetical protein|nr:helix-turn-helix domain-containing protein [Candidatus Methanovirga basalitermitum]
MLYDDMLEVKKWKKIAKSQIFRLYPSFEQEQILFQTLGVERYIFNQIKRINDFKHRYPCYGNSIESVDFLNNSKFSIINYIKEKYRFH